MHKKTLYVRKIRSPFGAAKGLIGKQTPFAILIYTRWGIHTFGMRYPIDVLVLNNKQTIVALKEHLKPNRIFVWNPLFTTLIELPKNTIQKKRLSIGQKIIIKEG